MLQYSWVSATSGVVQCGVWAELDTSSMMHHPAHCTIRYLPTQILKSEHLLSTVYLLSIYYLSTFYYILSTLFKGPSSCNPDAKRLFDDLLSSYNKLVRPVMNVTDAVTVKFKLKLSQLIDVVRIAATTTTTTFCSNSFGSQESFNLHTNWFVLELGPPPNEFRKRTYRNRKIQYAVDINQYSSDVIAWSSKGQVVLPLRFMSEARWAFAMLTHTVIVFNFMKISLDLASCSSSWAWRNS